MNSQFRIASASEGVYNKNMKRKLGFFLVLSLVLGILFCPAQASLAQVEKISVNNFAKTAKTDKLSGDPLKPATLPVSTNQMQLLGLKQNIYQNKIAQTAGAILISYLLLFIFVRIINRRISDLKTRYIIRKNIAYLINIILILFVVFIWLQNINSITIFLGVASAGLALALQEVILCIAAWFLILVRRPFEVGDRIELNGVKGDVIDIRIFQTSLLEIGNWVDADQSTGRIVNIPNSAIFKKESYNYSQGFEYIWNEIPILVTFESDWKVAEEIMMKHGMKYSEGTDANVEKKIHAMGKRYMIYYGKLTPIIYINIKDSGVEVTLRYLTEAKKRRATQDQLCRAILEDFSKEDKVNFAYPTYRIVKE